MKKVLVLLLSVILLFACLPTVSVYAAKQPTFVVSNEKANAGDTVKITVSTKNNSGIISMKLHIKYDKTALQLVEAEKGKFDSVVFGPKDNNPFIANWIEPLKPNNKKDGVVTTLTFKVLDTAPEGKSEISVSYDPDDVFDSKFNNVEFAVENGYVNITNPNGDKNTAASSQTASNTTTSDTSVGDTVENDAISSDKVASNTASGGAQSQHTHSQTESVAGDTTANQILEQFLDETTQQQNNTTKSQADWLMWVIIAAIIVLGGAIGVVIFKSKKDNK